MGILSHKTDIDRKQNCLGFIACCQALNYIYKEFMDHKSDYVNEKIINNTFAAGPVFNIILA